MKKNVLLLLTASYSGGAEMEVLDYVKNYNKNKFNISVITLRKGNIENIFQDVCRKYGVFYKCCNTSNFFNIRAFFELLRLVKEKDIQVIHANLLQSEIYSFFIKIFHRKVKIVSSKLAFNDFKKYFLYKILARILSLTNDRVIVISKALYSFYKERIGIPAKKLRVIYCGIDSAYFTYKLPLREIEKTRKKIKINKDDSVVGIVGRLEKVKNHKILFRAIKKLQFKIPKIKLIVIGTGKEKKELKRWVEKNELKNRIIFLDYQKDIRIFYRMMDVFCLPSFAEGFGKVLAESILCDAFVISSNTTAMKEVIKDKVDGLLFNPYNVDELVRNMLWVYENPKKTKKMVVNGKRHVKEKFGLKKIVKQKEELYMNVLRR